ncbi:MAG TPA: hemerythrin domain-containing protein [Burkholderiaceae bacterium]
MATKSTSTAGTASQSKKSGSSNIPTNKSTSKTDTGSSTKPADVKNVAGNQSDADVLLKSDHRKVEKLFQEYEAAEGEEEKKRLSNQICKELIVHTEVEEELFYPACRAAGVKDDMLDEAQVEHDGAKVLITQLITLPANSAYYDAKVRVLSEYIKHHVGEEEKASDGIFAKARTAGVDMTALGQRLQSRKEELLAQGDDNILQPPTPRSLEIPDFINHSFQENQTMSNQQTRDDQGRFSGNGNQGSSGGRHASDDRYDDRYDNNRQGGRSASGYRDRDEYGRFTSDDDSRGGGYYGRDENKGNGGRSSRSDYDDDYSSGRQGNQQSYGQGQGWHGDSEGHSQAARRGHQSSGRSDRGNYDDGRSDYRSSGNQGGQGHDHGGWYGDSEGHSQAARRGNQSSGRSDRGGYDDDGGNNRSSGNQGSRGGQGHGGWFGDSEGHSQAAHRGHQSSSGSNRGSNDDRSDHRSSGNQGGGNNQGQGHGGWFGDSRGHAEAARRGWENR